MAEAFYRLKSAGGDWTRVTGTAPITVTGLTEGATYEYLKGDGTIGEVTAGAAATVVPSITASDSLSGRDLTISVDSLTGDPAPTVTLTGLTLDAANVLGDETGSNPWIYTVPDSASAQTVAWTLEATNSEGTDTASGAESVPANLFAPTVNVAPTISGTIQPGETVTLNEGTYNGTTPITTTFTFTLDGADVTGDLVGADYTIPAGAGGQDLVYAVTPSNIVGAGAMQTVTETVQAVDNVAPGLIDPPELDAADVVETQQIAITQGSYSGEPTPNVSWSVFQNGLDVTPNYTETGGVVTGTPPGNTAGESWVYTETADNGVGDAITQQITMTVQDYVAAVAPVITVVGTLDYELAPEPQTIYLDYESGSDSNTGTDIANPRKTAPTGGVLSPGSKVIFKGGVKYKDPLEIKDVGEVDKRIEYLSNPNGDFGTGAAIIDGSVPQTGWGAAETVAGVTVYRRAGTFSTSRRYVQDGTLLTVAQMPAVPAENVHRVFGNTYTADSRGTDGSGNPTITHPSVFNGLSSSPVGALLWVRIEGNQEELLEITAYDSGTGTVTLEMPPEGKSVDRDIYAIYNHPDGLALKDGTYIFDRDTDEVLVRTAGDVDISTVDMGYISGGTAIQNKGSYVTIDGFTIQNWTGMAIWAQDGTTQRFGNYIKNVTARNLVRNAGNFGAISHYWQTDGRIENVTVSDAVGSLRGVMVNTCFNHVVKDADIQRTQSTLISNFGGDGNSFISVTGSNPAGVHANGMSLYTGGSNILVAFCEIILDQVAYAVTHQDSTGITFAFNTFAANSGARVVSGHFSDQGDGAHFIANNNIIQLRRTGNDTDQGYGRSTDGPANSTTVINNIADGLQNLTSDRFDMLLVEKNALLTKPALSADIDAIADRENIFVDILAPDVDFNLVASPPAWVSNGSEWSFQPDPNVAAVTVNHIGRYKPDGTDVLDPATLFVEE